MEQRINMEEIFQKNPLNEHRLVLSKAKLKAVSRTSALLSGFAMVAMVEISLDDHMQSETSTPLLITYSTLTCLLVSVHLLALMISTCIIPLLESNHTLSDEDFGTMHIYIEFAWILSTGFGIFLFLLEITVVCWVKFFFIARPAAIASTVIIIPIMLVFCIFSLHFYRRIVILKLNRHQNELIQIENRLSIIRFPIVNI